jgi:hypothetical protein
MKAGETAPKVGVTLVGPRLASPVQKEEYHRVILAMSQEGAEAIIASDQREHFTNRELIVELTEKYRLPMLWPYGPYGDLGAHRVRR